MSVINIVPASTVLTIEKLQIGTIFFNISDTSCSISVTSIDVDAIPNPSTVSTQTLILSGTDFSDNINIPAIKTWICTQLGYTES